MNADNKDVIERFFTLLKARDLPGLEALLSPDVTVRYYGPEGTMPWIGEFHGMAGFVRFLGIIAAEFDIVEVEPFAETADANRVVIQSRGRWRRKATGAIVQGNMVNVFTVSDGRISSYEIYNDTLAFWQVMQD